MAALGIAAHEVPTPTRTPTATAPTGSARRSPSRWRKFAPFSALFFIGGFWFGIPLLMALSLIYVFGLVVFALATLPVELGASRRALACWSARIWPTREEVGEVRSVLRAAAFTYVAGLAARSASSPH